MSNTDQAAEPTMEEILSSIRKIISDDDQDDAAGAAEPAPSAPKAKPVAEAPEPVAEAEIEPEPEPEPEVAAEEDPGDDIFELTDVAPEQDLGDEALFDSVSDDGATDLIDPDSIDDLEFSAPDPAPEPEIEPASEPRPAPPRPEMHPANDLDAGNLLSVEAGGAAASAFGQLAEMMVSRNGQGRTLEDLVQDMLRPMLKGWLDDNLPPLVERLVREEIERVARRR